MKTTIAVQPCTETRASLSRATDIGPGQLPGFDGARFAAWLRRRHRRDIGWEVWRRTGIAPGTAKNWLIGRCAPSVRHFLALAGAYGSEIVEAACIDAPDWLVAQAEAARLAVLEAEIAEREAARARLQADVQRRRG